MSMQRTMEEAKFTNIEKGTYTVTCIGVKEDTIPNPQYGNGDVIKFKLQFDDMVDDGGEDVIRETMASDYLTPGSKLTAILIAFGVTAEIGQNVNIDDCLGRKAQAKVGSVTKTVKGAVKTYDTIEELFALPKKPAPKATTPAESPETSADTGMSDFWAETRKRNWTAVEVINLSKELYGCAPAELASEDRVVLLEAIEAK